MSFESKSICVVKKRIPCSHFPEARGSHHFLLLGVKIANAYQRRILRRNLGSETFEVRQRFRAIPQRDGQRHPMDITGQGSLGSVHVRVRIQPDTADLPFLIVITGGQAGQRSDGDRVVPAQHQGDFAGPCGGLHIGS